MTDFHGIGAHADHRPQLLHRSQREAGIDHRAWEGRLKPMRPFWPEAMVCLMGAVVLGASILRAFGVI